MRLTRRGWVVVLMLSVIAAALVGALPATAPHPVDPVPMVPVSQVVEPPARWRSIVDRSLSVDDCAGIPFRGVPEASSGRCR